MPLPPRFDKGSIGVTVQRSSAFWRAAIHRRSFGSGQNHGAMPVSRVKSRRLCFSITESVVQKNVMLKHNLRLRLRLRSSPH
jgi:hypothetical protein